MEEKDYVEMERLLAERDKNKTDSDVLTYSQKRDLRRERSLMSDHVDLGGGIVVPSEDAKRAVQDLYTADEGMFPKIVRVLNVVTMVLCVIILLKG